MSIGVADVAWELATSRSQFCETEKLALLRMPGLGPKVVSRLEEQGLSSIEAIRELGVERVVEMVCGTVGSRAWRNRHAALTRALNSSVATESARGVNPKRKELMNRSASLSVA